MLILNTKNTAHIRKLRLDASTACQLKCPACPTASGEIGKKIGTGFLKFNQFKKLIDDNPQLSHIELSNWGELFLNKDILKIMKYAYAKNVALTALNGSNMNTISEDVLEGLVKYKFRRIKCSIDGVTQKTYEKYRKNGDVEQVFSNIRKINEYKAKYKSEFPQLHWQFIAFGHNEHEIGQARRMAADLNMSIYVKLNWADLFGGETFSPIKDKKMVQRETGLGVSDRYEFSDKFKGEYEQLRCCIEMWRQPQVNMDGQVLGCPINYWGNYGNAFKNGLKNVLNGERFTYAKNMLLGKVKEKKDIPCVKCKVYQQMKQKGKWINEEIIQSYYPTGRKYVMLENKILGVQKTAKFTKDFSEIKRRLRSGLFKQPNKSNNTLERLTSRIDGLNLPLQFNENVLWERHPIFRGKTKKLDFFSVGASILYKNVSPHLQHAHQEEELLLLLSGELDVIVPNKDKPEIKVRHHLKAGEFVYYPYMFKHTIQCVSNDPAQYVMFKWRGRTINRVNDTLSFRKEQMMKNIDQKNPRLIHKGKTRYLNKLRSHRTILKPAEVKKAHVDAYDVAIVILEGELKTLDQCVKPFDVVFYASGEPHGMENIGKTEAKYIVFEFHA